jgi:hypothetical protein
MIVGPGAQVVAVEQEAPEMFSPVSVVQKPHIGVVLPSGSVAFILCAVKLTVGVADAVRSITVWALAPPAVNRIVTGSIVLRRIIVFSVWIFIASLLN